MQPLTPTSAKPDMAMLRLIKESELRRGNIIGSGAFGTVYKVRPFFVKFVDTLMASNFVWFLFDQVEMCDIEIKDTRSTQGPRVSS